MKEIDVYEQYFAARGVWNGRPRHGALVKLTAVSDSGTVRYDVAVTFFPHDSEEDYAVSYDAFFSKTVYEGTGRRSKKREETLLSSFREQIDALAAEAGGAVLWDQPLRDARRG